MLTLNIPPWKIFGWFRRPQLWAPGDRQLQHDSATAHASPRLIESFWWNIKSPTWLKPPYSPDWVPCASGFSWNYNHLWKGRDFRPLMRFRKIQQSRWWCFQQRILQSVLDTRKDAGRTGWRPKVPSLKGTEESFPRYHVSCIWYLL